VSSVGWVIKNRVSVRVWVRYWGADVRDGDFGGLFSGWKNVLHSSIQLRRYEVAVFDVFALFVFMLSLLCFACYRFLR